MANTMCGCVSQQRSSPPSVAAQVDIEIEGVIACRNRKLPNVTAITRDQIFPYDGTGTAINGPIEKVPSMGTAGSRGVRFLSPPEQEIEDWSGSDL